MSLEGITTKKSLFLHTSLCDSNLAFVLNKSKQFKQ